MGRKQCERPFLLPTSAKSLSRAWNVISVISIKEVIAARGYTFFVVMLYLMMGGLAAALGLCFQVGYSVRQPEFYISGNPYLHTPE